MKVKVFIVLLFAFLALVNITASEKTQIPEGPHGGAVKAAGSYYIEMKNPYEQIFAFLLDRNFKSINNKFISCSVRFYYNDSTSTDMQLEPYEEDGFVSPSTIPNFTNCKVRFFVQGKMVEAKFDNTALFVKIKD